MRVEFDAYTATTRAAGPAVLKDILADHAGTDWKASEGPVAWKGFAQRYAIKGEDGQQWASLLWGGQHRDLVMLEVKGERTAAVVTALRSRVPHHRCTRVDSAADLEQPGCWEQLLGIGLELKAEYRLRGEKRGDWDFPQDGRTLYLGAHSSAVRMRIYEKGKEPGFRHLERHDWVRPEVQVRPEKDARIRYAGASAVDVWGAAPWTRDFAGRVLAAQVQPLPPYVARRENSRDATLGWMCEQYGAHLISLKEDLGSWSCVGETIWEMIQERTERRRRAKARR